MRWACLRRKTIQKVSACGTPICLLTNVSERQRDTTCSDAWCAVKGAIGKSRAMRCLAPLGSLTPAYETTYPSEKAARLKSARKAAREAGDEPGQVYLAPGARFR